MFTVMYYEFSFSFIKGRLRFFFFQKFHGLKYIIEVLMHLMFVPPQFQTHGEVSGVAIFVPSTSFWGERYHTVPTLCECKHMSVFKSIWGLLPSQM